MNFCRPAGEFDQLNNCIYVNSATLSDRLFLTKHKHSLSAFVGSFEETKSKMSQLLKKRLGKYCWYGFEHIENKGTVLLITFHSHPCCQSLCPSWILEQSFFYLNQLKNMNRYCDKNSLPCCKVCLSLNCVCRKLSKNPSLAQAIWRLLVRGFLLRKKNLPKVTIIFHFSIFNLKVFSLIGGVRKFLNASWCHLGQEMDRSFRKSARLHARTNRT